MTVSSANHSALHILTYTSHHTLVARLQSTAVAAPTDHQMLHPPSTTRFWPVSQSLASLESSATAPLMSRDRPVTCSLRIRPTKTAPAFGSASDAAASASVLWFSRVHLASALDHLRQVRAHLGYLAR